MRGLDEGRSRERPRRPALLKWQPGDGQVTASSEASLHRGVRPAATGPASNPALGSRRQARAGSSLGKLCRVFTADPRRPPWPTGHNRTSATWHLPLAPYWSGACLGRSAMAPPAGFEPALPPPEGGALSPELRGPVFTRLGGDDLTGAVFPLRNPDRIPRIPRASPAYRHVSPDGSRSSSGDAAPRASAVVKPMRGAHRPADTLGR